MLIVENGSVAWDAGPMVTVAQADAYASDRGWTEWAALDEARKSAAILDASTYVRSVYRPPAKVSDATEDQISGAVIEASRLAVSAPLMGGADAGKRVRRSVKAGSVAVEYEGTSTGDLNKARLALVIAMLRAAGAYAIGSGVNVRLAKS